MGAIHSITVFLLEVRESLFTVHEALTPALKKVLELFLVFGGLWQDPAK